MTFRLETLHINCENEPNGGESLAFQGTIKDGTRFSICIEAPFSEDRHRKLKILEFGLQSVMVAECPVSVNALGESLSRALS